MRQIMLRPRVEKSQKFSAKLNNVATCHYQKFYISPRT